MNTESKIQILKLFLNQNKHSIFQIVKVFIASIAIFFIAKYISLNIKELSNYKFYFNYYYLSFSIVLCVLSLLNNSFIWHFITKIINCNINLKDAVVARVYSDMGKYIPGKVFGYAILLYTYAKADKSKRLVSLCMLIELIAVVFTSALVFVFSLFFIDIPSLEKYKGLFVLALIFCFIIIHPKFVNFFLKYLFKIFRYPQYEIAISYKKLLSVILLNILNVFFGGAALLFFINSIYPVSYTDFIFIFGASSVAGIIGLFAIFVPAGLGVREGVMVIALSYVMPASYAGIIALTSRIWYTIGEVLLFCIVYLSIQLKRTKNQ